MILDQGEPIDLGPVLAKLRLGVELLYLDVPRGVSAFDHEGGRKGVAEGLDEFLSMVDDSSEHENRIRRGLAWLLHQNDDVLAEVLGRGEMAFPTPLIADRRRYLEMIWDHVFAPWQAEGFAAEEYEVLGLPE